MRSTLNTTEAAEALGVHPSAISRWRRRGLITPTGGTPGRPEYDGVQLLAAASAVETSRRTARRVPCTASTPENGLRAWRDRHHYTLRDLSNATGYSVGHLSRIERGERTFTRDALVEFCHGLRTLGCGDLTGLYLEATDGPQEVIHG